MSLTLIILIVVAVAVLVIRAKINAIHKMIEDKINLITDLAGPAATVSRVISGVAKSVRPKK